MKKCNSCMKKIDENAKRCPYCRHDQRNWFRRHPVLTILGILILSPIWITFLIAFFQSASSNYSGSEDKANITPEPTRKSELNAKVNFDGAQFTITNLEPYDCESSRITVNGDYRLTGYTLEAENFYTVGAGQFTKGDGTRLNPFTIKPQNVSISCSGSNELSSAFWYGEF